MVGLFSQARYRKAYEGSLLPANTSFVSAEVISDEDPVHPIIDRKVSPLVFFNAFKSFMSYREWKPFLQRLFGLRMFLLSEVSARFSIWFSDISIQT